MVGDAPRESRQPRRSVERLEFPQGDPAELYGCAHELAQHRTGWVTMEPRPVEGAEAPAEPGLLSTLVSTADPRHQLPLCTWVPGHRSKRGTKPDSLGIQHGTGTRAAARLADRGVPVPDGWRRAQDHPRRGLVVVPPVGCPVEEMLSWLLRAGAVLSEVPVTGRWRAEVHRRS